MPWVKSYTIGRDGSSSLLALDNNAAYRSGVESFLHAVAQTKEQIRHLQDQLKENFVDIGSLIFHAHLLMLTGRGFFRRDGATDTLRIKCL